MKQSYVSHHGLDSIISLAVSQNLSNEQICERIRIISGREHNSAEIIAWANTVRELINPKIVEEEPKIDISVEEPVVEKPVVKPKSKRKKRKYKRKSKKK